MKQAVFAAFVVTAAIGLPTAAFAQAGNLTVPAGDALEQTPPIDVKGKEIRNAPPGEVSRGKLRDLHEDGSTAHRVDPTQP